MTCFALPKTTISFFEFFYGNHTVDCILKPKVVQKKVDLLDVSLRDIHGLDACIVC